MLRTSDGELVQDGKSAGYLAAGYPTRFLTPYILQVEFYHKLDTTVREVEKTFFF